MPTPHKHAALIKQWADDPSQEIWFWAKSDRRWRMSNLANMVAYTDGGHYAVGPKPTQPPLKTCVLAGVEFPAPATEMPARGQDYWAALPHQAIRYPWCRGSTDVAWFEAGLVHLTREAAEQHSKALLAANKQAIEAAA